MRLAQNRPQRSKKQTKAVYKEKSACTFTTKRRRVPHWITTPLDFRIRWLRQTRSLKGNRFLIGVMRQRRHATSGSIILIGNHGAARDYDHARLHCFVRLMRLPFAVYSDCGSVSLVKNEPRSFLVQRTLRHSLRSQGRRVGFVPTYGLFSTLRVFSAPQPNPSPPTSG
jgi:hypothetical protein